MTSDANNKHILEGILEGIQYRETVVKSTFIKQGIYEIEGACDLELKTPMVRTERLIMRVLKQNNIDGMVTLKWNITNIYS
jgi:hypothetical protein